MAGESISLAVSGTGRYLLFAAANDAMLGRSDEGGLVDRAVLRDTVPVRNAS